MCALNEVLGALGTVATFFLCLHFFLQQSNRSCLLILTCFFLKFWQPSGVVSDAALQTVEKSVLVCLAWKETLPVLFLYVSFEGGIPAQSW